jgi:hypothetical protein
MRAMPKHFWVGHVENDVVYKNSQYREHAYCTHLIRGHTVWVEIRSKRRVGEHKQPENDPGPRKAPRRAYCFWGFIQRHGGRHTGSASQRLQIAGHVHLNRKI